MFNWNQYEDQQQGDYFLFCFKASALETILTICYKSVTLCCSVWFWLMLFFCRPLTDVQGSEAPMALTTLLCNTLGKSRACFSLKNCWCGARPDAVRLGIVYSYTSMTTWCEKFAPSHTNNPPCKSAWWDDEHFVWSSGQPLLYSLHYLGAATQKQWTSLYQLDIIIRRKATEKTTRKGVFLLMQ